MVMVIEVALWTIVLYLLITQVLIPLIKGTRTFPMFRKEQKLREEIVDVNQKVLEKDLEKQIQITKKKEGV